MLEDRRRRTGEGDGSGRSPLEFGETGRGEAPPSSPKQVGVLVTKPSRGEAPRSSRDQVGAKPSQIHCLASTLAAADRGQIQSPDDIEGRTTRTKRVGAKPNQVHESESGRSPTAPSCRAPSPTGFAKKNRIQNNYVFCFS